jgi:hypothetical protein
LHLERRESYLICPHCQGCCSRIKEGRERCIRDLPMLDRPVTLRLHISPTVTLVRHVSILAVEG